MTTLGSFIEVEMPLTPDRVRSAIEQAQGCGCGCGCGPPLLSERPGAATGQLARASRSSASRWMRSRWGMQSSQRWGMAEAP